MFYESGLADLGERPRLYAFPFAALAAKLGYASNMIALGVMIALTEPVTFDSMAKAIRQSFSETLAAKNLEAVRYGLELAKEAPGKRAQAV